MVASPENMNGDIKDAKLDHDDARDLGEQLLGLVSEGYQGVRTTPL
jgi:hypothetical protein